VHGVSSIPVLQLNKSDEKEKYILTRNAESLEVNLKVQQLEAAKVLESQLPGTAF
jgi:hypothetical protein